MGSIGADDIGGQTAVNDRPRDDLARDRTDLAEERTVLGAQLYRLAAHWHGRRGIALGFAALCQALEPDRVPIAMAPLSLSSQSSVDLGRHRRHHRKHIR